ncbi:hypothetical protein MY3296_009388 [Beauveria thailandica]
MHALAFLTQANRLALSSAGKPAKPERKSNQALCQLYLDLEIALPKILHAGVF